MKLTNIVTLAALVSCGGAHAQQQTGQRSSWHRSAVVNYTHPNAGLPSGMGTLIAIVPTGYLGVVEHVSARCNTPPSLAILYGAISVRANPGNPRQSEPPTASGEEMSAAHQLIFQRTFSGATHVHVASQPMKLRIDLDRGPIVFQTFFLSDTPDAQGTCVVSLSGYLEKR